MPHNYMKNLGARYMPMKIAIATDFPIDPNQPSGGVQAVSVTLVRALAALDDLCVDVVTRDADRTQIEIQDWRGARIHRLPRGKRHTLTDAVTHGRRQLHEYLPSLSPDVIHAHDTYGLMVKGLDIPRVFTIHGFIHADTLLAGRRLAWIRSKLWKWIETGGWAEQPHIISISPYVRERLSGVAGGVIHDIDNPISEVFFDVPRAERKGTIFCAAVICRRKNQIALVEALAHLRKQGVDAELRLAGPISEPAYGRRMHEHIDALNLGEHVKLLGAIGSDQVRAELAAAGAFALVSYEEGSPMGIEEAMAVGVPVVTSNRCGMPYMVRDGETGYLVDPDDPADIAARMAELMNNDARRADMSAYAREIARDRFHPEAVARRTREVYRRAVQEGAECCSGNVQAAVS